MINLNAGRYALSVCVTASLLAGCGNAQSSPTLPLGTSSTHGTTARHWAGSVRHASVTETVIHSFGGQGDGAVPFAGLTYLNGTLYGTTESGGTSNGGTVYSITPSGTETVLYGFMGGQDGAFPRSDLINVNGTFYGTTDEEGACCGTVYSVTPSGRRRSCTDSPLSPMAQTRVGCLTSMARCTGRRTMVAQDLGKGEGLSLP